ncbi:hypothetical protein HMPREF1545_02299 [Oscillibacter sp. KLE 1728]|nr:hypothetical protein HMPREF1545_02299 [Oscillibacter sp. KLE 1728]ERK65726.1 hypothetical protein HMPREF1546_01113 [Oscillibacter sp. KLE 1745]
MRRLLYSATHNTTETGNSQSSGKLLRENYHLISAGAYLCLQYRKCCR